MLLLQEPKSGSVTVPNFVAVVYIKEKIFYPDLISTSHFDRPRLNATIPYSGK